MKALRFLTILLTAFSLYTVQTVVSVPGLSDSVSYAGSDSDQTGFFSQGAGSKVGLDGEEKKGDDKAGFNMNMIILFGAMMGGALYVMHCIDTMDTWIFVATAGIYIGAEIANFNQYTAQSKQAMEAYDTGNADANMAQQRSLYEAAAQTEAAAKAAERRGQAAQMAAMGFAAAGALALVLTTLSYMPDPYCIHLCENKGYKCTKGAMSNNSLERDYINGPKQKSMIAGADFKNMENYVASAENDFDFLIRQVELERYRKGALQSATAKVSEEIEMMYAEKKQENMFVSTFKTIGYNIADAIFPKAHATKGMGIGAVGLGAGAAALLGHFFLESMSPGFRSGMRNGFVRAAGHLAFFAVAQIVAGDSKEAANKLRGRANQYKELAMKLGTRSMNISNHDKIDNTYEVGKAEALTIDKGSKTEVKTCFTGGKGKLNEDKSCACKSSKGCKKPELPKIKMAKVNIPDAIKTSSSTLGTAGSSIFNGDLEGGLANSNAAGKNAARLRKLSVGLKDKANQVFTAAGGKAIDFDKLEASSRNRLIKTAAADIKNLNADARKALSNQFPGVFGNGADVEKDPNADIKVGDTNIKTGGGDLKVTNSGSGKSKDPMAGFSFDIDENEADIKPAEQEAFALNEATGDQVETNKDDIAGDRNKNIFSLITKRYFKTAYPRFFSSADSE